MTLTIENEPPRNNISLEQTKSYVASDVTLQWFTNVCCWSLEGGGVVWWVKNLFKNAIEDVLVGWDDQAMLTMSGHWHLRI